MLQGDWLPLFATFGDDLVVKRDLGAQDLGLSVFQTEGSVKEEVVLKGLSIDVIDELSLLPNFLVKIDCGFDAAYIVRKGDWEDRSGCTQGNACFVVFGLVEGDFDSLVLTKVLGHQLMPYTINKKLEGVGPDQTSTCYRI